MTLCLWFLEETSLTVVVVTHHLARWTISTRSSCWLPRITTIPRMPPRLWPTRLPCNMKVPRRQPRSPAKRIVAGVCSKSSFRRPTWTMPTQLRRRRQQVWRRIQRKPIGTLVWHWTRHSSSHLQRPGARPAPANWCYLRAAKLLHFRSKIKEGATTKRIAARARWCLIFRKAMEAANLGDSSRDAARLQSNLSIPERLPC